jgi:hypothetical protein
MVVFSMLSASRSLFSSFSAFSNIWIRYNSTVPEFVRPPGPIVSWTKDQKNAWQRYRYATEPKFRQSMLKSVKVYQARPEVKVARNEFERERYTNDAAFRSLKLERGAQRRAIPEYRNFWSQYARDRYAHDPDYRKEALERRHRWRSVPENWKRECQQLKERYANDPEFRERMKQRAREAYWKKKFGLATGRAEPSESQAIPDAPDKSGEQDAKP